MTLPSAPPSTSARPAASSACVPRGRRHSQTTMAMLTRDGEADEQPSLPARGRGEKAERGADIVHAGDVENRQHAW